jgi:hypothetical protein
VTSVLIALLLSAHLLCMNVASAGPLVCIWLDYLPTRNPSAASAGKWLAWKSFQLAILGALLGLIIGWLRWDAEFSAVLQRFSSRITWGVAEFIFSVALLACYAAWLSARPQTTSAKRFGRSLLSILSATNLLYHFPTLFTLIAKAHAGRIEATGRIDSAAFRRLIGESDVLAMTAHFGLASIAVSGVALVVFAWYRGDQAESERVAVWGARTALASTVLQIPVGTWLLLAVPRIPQQRLMGGDWVGSSLFILSMAGVLALLHLLAAVAFGNVTRQSMLRAIQGMLLVVVLMTGVLQRLNQ